MSGGRLPARAPAPGPEMRIRKGQATEPEEIAVVSDDSDDYRKKRIHAFPVKANKL